MKITRTKNRELFDLSFVLIISVTFALLSISINFIDGIYNYFNSYTSLPIAEFLINVTFLWLAGLLWITSCHWRKAVKKQKDLEEIISSISPDTLIFVDRDRNIMMCNASVKRMFGYEMDEIINQKTDLLYFDRRSEPSHRHEMHDKLKRDGFHIGLATGKKKNGDIISLEIITGNLSSRSGAVLLLRDITEHIRTEEKYQRLIEHANDAVISTNKEGMIIGFNKKAEEMFGYAREEVLGKSVKLLSSSIYKEKNRKMVEELRKSNKSAISGETLVEKRLRKDGQEILIESSSYILDIHGEYIITDIIRDISERKQMEHKLLQSEKLKSLGELAGGVAHDFNNVLAAILGRAQLLKIIVDPPPGKEERRKSVIEMRNGLEIIEKAAKDGAETVKRIQEFSRKRDDDKYFTTVDLNEIIDNVLEFTRVRWKDDAESKEIKINIEKELSPLPLTSGSASELREVFTNFINNALDAMPQGGNIKIKTFKENSHISIKVEDTGIGIPKAIRDRIFDPFFTTKGVQSSGLGMSVSYGIINRHRGTIKVDSIEGKGTTFTIKLPISEKVLKEEKKIKPFSGKQKKSRILAVANGK